MKKTFLTGIIILIHFLAYCQAKKKNEEHNSSNQVSDNTNAIVTILWSGSGQIKLVINKNEYFFSEGEKKTLNFSSQTAYSIKAEQSGRNYVFGREIFFGYGIQTRIVGILHDSLLIINPDQAIKDLSSEMTLVNGGKFCLGCGNVWGSPCDDSEKRSDSGIVTLNGFYIAKYDVTQEQWEAIMGYNPSYFKNCTNCPVENISWLDTQEFIKRINELSGKHYRLPTSAEWEYAARGAAKSKGDFFAGNSGDIAWNVLNEMLWKFVMKDSLPGFKNCDECLIQNLSYENAMSFIAKLNQDEGSNRYRIPSKSNWEEIMEVYKGGHKYAGSNNLDQVAWYYGNSDYKTHPVGQKAPNELGLYDMNGNVWQWCNDWFGMDTADYNYSPPSSYFGNNPQGPEKGKKRMIRGSAWWTNKSLIRITVQYGWEPTYRFSDVGFRLVRD